MNFVKKISLAINKMYTNYINDKHFNNYHYSFSKIMVKIPDDKIDDLYDKKIYEDISRCGPGLVREIHKNVSHWCEQAKGKVEIPYAYNIENSIPVFYFSRQEVAEEFKLKFLQEV